MLRWSLLMLAVVGVMAGLFVALASGPESRLGGPGRPGPAPATPRGANPAQPPAQPADLVEGQDGPGRVAPEDPGDQRHAVPSQVPLAVQVETIDGGPVAGARVTLLDRVRVKGWQEVWDDPRQRDAFVRRHGTTETANVRGRVIFRNTSNGVLVGLGAGLSGSFEWNSPIENPLRLVLRPEFDLKVRVVDKRGRPQRGVRVSVVRELGGQSMSVLTRQTVGDEAIAVFSRIGRQLGAKAATGQRYHVTLGFPCLNPPRIDLDPAAIPEEVLLIELPPVGSLEVRVVDERGMPVREVANASLGRLTRGVGGQVFIAEHNARLIGGSATFTYVGVGAPVALKLAGSRERPDQIEEHSGPSRAAEVKRITVRWTDLYPVLLGVAVSETGEVLKARRGRYMVWSDGRGSGGPPLITGQDGSFRLVISSPLEAEPSRSAELELYARDGNRPLQATLDLSGRLAPGESDIGHVTFQPKPDLVSGLVRDVAGNGLTGVHVRVLIGETNGLNRAATLSATTLGDGSFAIYGTVADDFQLVAVRRGYKTVRQEGVAPGSSGLELVMLPDLPNAGDGRR